MKVAYSFLIVKYLQESSNNFGYMDQVYGIAGFLACFELAWLVALPMNIKKEYLNFAVLIFAQISMFALLFLPWYWHDDLGLTLIVMIPFWCMLATLIIEVCLNIYKIIPVDLYEVGLKIVIEDKELLA